MYVYVWMMILRKRMIILEGTIVTYVQMQVAGSLRLQAAIEARTPS